MSKKTIAIVLILLAVGVVIYWFADGAYIYTVEQVQVETVDPLFGTKSTGWKDEFHLGLLPGVAAVCGVLVAIALWLFWSAARAGRRPAV